MTVLVECDAGAMRCGVQTPQEAVALARTIARHPGLRFGGLMTCRPRGSAAATQAWLVAAKSALDAAGLPPEVIPTGGTPDLTRAADVSVATEYRPGTCI